MAAKKKSKRNKRRIVLPENLTGVLAGGAALLACFWQVGLTNRFGDQGSAFYTAALDAFLVLFVLFGAGLFKAVSSMVASRVDRGTTKAAVKVMRTAAFGSVAAGLMLWFIGFLLSGFWADSILGLSLARLSLQGFLPALAPLFLLLVLTGAMDGFGSANRVNLCWFVFCLVFFAAGPILTGPAWNYGQKVGALLQNPLYGPAYGAMGGALALVLASICAALAGLIAWFHLKPGIYSRQLDAGGMPEKTGQIYRGVVLQSLPVTLPATLIAAGIAAQGLLFFHSAGEETADSLMTSWGIYAGKSRPLFCILLLTAAAFSLRMLPGLRIGYLHRNLKRSRERCMVTLRCIALMMVPAAAFCLVMAKTIIGAFYKTGDVETAAVYLRLGSISILFYGLAIGLCVVLESAEFTMEIVIGALAAVVVQLLSLFCMLEFMELSIYGVIYANLIQAFVLCLIYFIFLQSRMRIRISWLRIFLAPLVGSAVMTGVVALVGLVFLKNAASMLTLIVCGILGFCVYFVVVILLRGATARELRAFPGGEKLIGFARLLRLM